MIEFMPTEAGVLTDLCFRTLHGLPADREKLNAVEPDKLFALAQKHCVASIVAAAFEKADDFSGSETERWKQAKDHALRRHIILETEKEEVCRGFDRRGIRYLPLKGNELQKLYPTGCIRPRSDIDILVEPEKREAIREYLESIGYTCVKYDGENHDSYDKEPITHLEIHSYLFYKKTNAASGYFRNVWERLLRVSETSSEYRFSDNDFYIYTAAHILKHFEHGGVGLRSLADIYVMISSDKLPLDFGYIENEFRLLKTGKEEKLLRSLAYKLFSETAEELTKEEKTLWDECMEAGKYGTSSTILKKALTRYSDGEITAASRFGYIVHRLFPGKEHIKSEYPICRKHPVLVPAYTVYRLLDVFKKSKKISEEFNFVVAYQEKGQGNSEEDPKNRT